MVGPDAISETLEEQISSIGKIFTLNQMPMIGLLIYQLLSIAA